MSMLVSVIVCTHNRPETLVKTIKSILGQKTNDKFNYEVLLVDNNSTDNTKALIEGYAAKSSGRIRYIFEKRPGKTYALNAAVKEARGEILIFTDDDVIADQSWLESIMDCFLSYHCDGVGGRVLPTFPEATPKWVKKHATQVAGGVVIYDMGEDIRPLDKTVERFIGANYAFRKNVFADCGLFRTDLGPGQGVIGEDTEFFHRLVKKNKKLYYCGKALVWHPVDLKRLTLQHLAEWHIALGRFSARMEFENKEQKFVYCFGAPRYLFLGIFRDFFGMCFHCFSRLSFLRYFRGFFRKIGMISEYRNIHKLAKSGKSYQNA